MPAPERDDGIVVGGCPSAGTTLVRAILDSHSTMACGPELAIFDRSYIYRWPYTRFRALLEITAPVLERTFHVRGNSGFHFNAVAEVLDASAAGLGHTHFSPGLEFGRTNLASFVSSWDELVELARSSDDYDDFFHRFFAGYAERQGKARWAEKTPENIVTAADLLARFPGYRFVHVRRHPLDTVASMVRRRRNPFTLDAALARCAACLRGRAACLGHDRFLELDYEALVKDPERTVAGLMAFLGAAPEAGQLAYYEVERPGTGEYARGPIFTSSVGRWRRDLTRDEARRAKAFLRAHAGRGLEGYRLPWRP